MTHYESVLQAGTVYLVNAALNIFKRVYKKVERWSVKPMVLRNFQEELEKVPKLTDKERDELVSELVETAECPWLLDLLVKEVGRDGVTPMLHLCMVDSAREIWKQAFLMFESGDRAVTAKNTSVLKTLIESSFRKHLEMVAVEKTAPIEAEHNTPVYSEIAVESSEDDSSEVDESNYDEDENDDITESEDGTDECVGDEKPSVVSTYGDDEETAALDLKPVLDAEPLVFTREYDEEIEQVHSGPVSRNEENCITDEEEDVFCI